MGDFVEIISTFDTYSALAYCHAGILGRASSEFLYVASDLRAVSRRLSRRGRQ